VNSSLLIKEEKELKKKQEEEKIEIAANPFYKRGFGV
jgi:hypothetical protein